MIHQTPPYKYNYEKESFMDRYFHLIWISGLLLVLMAIPVLLLLLCMPNAHAEEISIPTIIQIESSGNPRAHNGIAVGLCQITKPVLQEYNDKWDTDWIMADLYNPDLNVIICEWYFNSRIPSLLRHYHIKDTVPNRIFCYNEGIGNLKKGIRCLESRKYVNKYYRLLKG